MTQNKPLTISQVINRAVALPLPQRAALVSVLIGSAEGHPNTFTALRARGLLVATAPRVYTLTATGPADRRGDLGQAGELTRLPHWGTVLPRRASGFQGQQKGNPP